MHPDVHRGAGRRVPTGVHEEVLDHALDLPGVHVHEHRVRLDTDRVRLHPGELARDLVREFADVGRRPLRLDVAAVQPVEVEEVVDEPVHLLPALLDHVEQRAPLLVGQPELLGALERLHRAEDPGERALQVVRDGVQEGVLHLVQLAEPGRDGRLLARGAPTARR